jgi:hypothetical protein
MAVAALTAALLAAGACERVQPRRTLPGWVRGVYVPMFTNKTTEPGLEELATRLTQEEFLADGRVNVVRKRDADLQLVASIEEYRIRVEDTDNDNIPSIHEVTISASLQLFDPLAPDRPLADLGRIDLRTYHNADPRSIGYAIEPEVKRLVMEGLARRIVDRTIHGFPSALDALPTGAPATGEAEAPGRIGMPPPE